MRIQASTLIALSLRQTLIISSDLLSNVSVIMFKPLTSNFALLYIFYVHLLAIRTRNASRLKHDHHLFPFIAFYHAFNFHTTVYSKLDRYRLNSILFYQQLSVEYRLFLKSRNNHVILVIEKTPPIDGWPILNVKL